MHRAIPSADAKFTLEVGQISGPGHYALAYLAIEILFPNPCIFAAEADIQPRIGLLFMFCRCCAGHAARRLKIVMTGELDACDSLDVTHQFIQIERPVSRPPRAAQAMVFAPSQPRRLACLGLAWSGPGTPWPRECPLSGAITGLSSRFFRRPRESALRRSAAGHRSTA